MLSAIKNYLVESVHEIRKVSWPTKTQLKNYTMLVVIMSVSMVIFFGLIDYVLSQGLAILLTKG